MSKRQLIEPLNTLEHEIIQTLIAGHKEWRPDLSYPESYSDMQGAVRGLFRMFKIERRALPETLLYPCTGCGGLGYLMTPRGRDDCEKCACRGSTP